MRSVSHFNQPAQKLFYISGKSLKGYFDKTLKGEYHSFPRQFFPKTFLPNGYIDILKASFIKKKTPFTVWKKNFAFHYRKNIRYRLQGGLNFQGLKIEL